MAEVTATEQPLIRVLISYAQESDAHRARVRLLNDQLCCDGIDSMIDLYDPHPETGWPIWMEQQLQASDFVLVVFTETYWKRSEGHEEPGRGWGVAWEADLIKQELYESPHRNARIIPVVFTAEDEQFITAKLRAVTRYRLDEKSLTLNDESNNYCKLFRHLTNQPQYERPEVGALVRLPSLPTEARRNEPNLATSAPRNVRGSAAGRKPGVPFQLPPAAARFFGRATVLKTLIERLERGLNTTVVGLAGMGKTALAAEALAAVVSQYGDPPNPSPVADGIVFLDLYTDHGQADPIWNKLADIVGGDDFEADKQAKVRATNACADKRLLVIFEGAEEADGLEGRPKLAEILKVLSPPSWHLVLLRDRDHTAPSEWVRLDDPLERSEAEQLFDSLTTAITVASEDRAKLLDLLQGHPLALNWAGNMLAQGLDHPARLIEEWTQADLPALHDPADSEHRTLRWLFERSVRRLDRDTRRALAAAGVLARTQFHRDAIDAALRPSFAKAVWNWLRRLWPFGRSFEIPSAGVLLPQLAARGLIRPASDPDHWEFSHALSHAFARAALTASALGVTNLAKWLCQQLQSRLSQRGAAPSSEETQRLLEHASAVLSMDRQHSRYRPLCEYLLFEACDRLVALGRLSYVGLALATVQAWFNQLPQPMADQPQWQRVLFISSSKFGDIAVATGDLSKAETAYRQVLAINQRLAEFDPANAEWQRDLSVSFNKLGDLATAQGNLPEAQRLFGEDLRIAQRLAESDPANAEWQRDLAVSLHKLGVLHMKREQWADALPLLEQTLAICERLAALSPTKVVLQEDILENRELLAEARKHAQGGRDDPRVQRQRLSAAGHTPSDTR